MRYPWAFKASLVILFLSALCGLTTELLFSGAEALADGAETAFEAQAAESALTLNAMSSAVLATQRTLNDVARVLLVLAIPFFLAGGVASYRLIHNGLPATPKPSLTGGSFVEHLNVLVASLASLEQRYSETADALQDAEAERERNEQLISMTRAQAQQVQAEIRIATTTGSRMQLILALLSISLTIVFFGIGIALSL